VYVSLPVPYGARIHLYVASSSTTGAGVLPVDEMVDCLENCLTPVGTMETVATSSFVTALPHKLTTSFGEPATFNKLFKLMLVRLIGQKTAVPLLLALSAAA
jgi:hypothetical protein